MLLRGLTSSRSSRSLFRAPTGLLRSLNMAAFVISKKAQTRSIQLSERSAGRGGVGLPILIPYRNSARSVCFLGPTQLRAAVVGEDPGEDGILGEVVAAAVRQVVEVEEILVVAQKAALPLQHVALCCVLGHVVL